ncbi:Alpha/Beta hydrolase protein [Geranomyces variabilis]|nr:Alpha/Beta hydrolase protein [Geranomyces variabilis]KAJ3142388.1 hypothetical protein HDU90_004661 [Geranomyces variabilis]
MSAANRPPSSFTPRERTFTLPSTKLILAAQEWGNTTGGTPILALHGYLDNSQTWSAFLPIFLAKNPNCHIVALDFAGHGRSGHRSKEAQYGIFEYARDVIEVVNLLGWSKFALLAHSMSGYVSFTLAAALPARITHVVSVECMHPWVVDNAGAANNVLRALKFEDAASRRATPRARKTYPSLAAIAAVRAASSAAMPLSLGAAELLMERNTVADPEGVVTAITDMRLKDPSPYIISVPLAKEAWSHITCPTLVVLATGGNLLAMWPEAGSASNGIPGLVVKELPGKHHLHLDDDVELVVDTVLQWFGEHPLLRKREMETSAPVVGYKL